MTCPVWLKFKKKQCKVYFYVYERALQISFFLNSCCVKSFETPSKDLNVLNRTSNKNNFTMFVSGYIKVLKRGKEWYKMLQRH